MESKAEVRRRHRAKRALLSPADSAERGERLAQVLQEQIDAGSLVLGYLPMGGEPDLTPFLRAHADAGGRVLVPVVADVEERRLAWSSWSGSAQLQRSVVPVLMEPAGPRLTTEDLAKQLCWEDTTVLVPAVAVDTQGGRLGQGGGFYDSLFAAHPGLSAQARLLAVVHPHEVLPGGSFPVEDHDLRVQQAATPDGIIELSGPHRPTV